MNISLKKNSFHTSPFSRIIVEEIAPLPNVKLIKINLPPDYSAVTSEGDSILWAKLAREKKWVSGKVIQRPIHMRSSVRVLWGCRKFLPP